MSMSKSLNVPAHVGLILDGNRRWAKEHGVSVLKGHQAGYYNLKTILYASIRYGVRYVTAYAFSSENWLREKQEVRDLMKLMLWVLKHELKELDREGIQLKVVGSKLKLGAGMVSAIHKAEQQTANNTRGTLLICLDYGGQQEIVEATKRIAVAGYEPEAITPELISHYMYAPDVPPIDLVIRTSGEQRLSNFMLWKVAYSELLFTKTYWPDFSEAELQRALATYTRRKRRFGQ
jgi:undecaprenyl diphosphate synthase